MNSRGYGDFLLLFQHGVNLVVMPFRGQPYPGGFPESDRCSYETVLSEVRYDVYRRAVFHRKACLRSG